ncbi:cation:proton antiporter [bacterium]|nr:cation:proton antiporter [bacterium]
MVSNTILWIWILTLAIGIILIFIRMIIGPGKANRTMALDTLTTVTTSLLIIVSIKFKNPFFLDIAIVYAILAFASVIIIARYIEKGV